MTTSTGAGGPKNSTVDELVELQIVYTGPKIGSHVANSPSALLLIRVLANAAAHGDYITMQGSHCLCREREVLAELPQVHIVPW